MRLALEGGMYANADTQALGEFLGTLAADVGFELWLRETSYPAPGVRTH